MRAPPDTESVVFTPMGVLIAFDALGLRCRRFAITSGNFWGANQATLQRLRPVVLSSIQCVTPHEVRVSKAVVLPGACTRLL